MVGAAKHPRHPTHGQVVADVLPCLPFGSSQNLPPVRSRMKRTLFLLVFAGESNSAEAPVLQFLQRTRFLGADGSDYLRWSRERRNLAPYSDEELLGDLQEVMVFMADFDVVGVCLSEDRRLTFVRTLPCLLSTWLLPSVQAVRKNSSNRQPVFPLYREGSYGNSLYNANVIKL